MTRFTTRVELHDADWSDYDELHGEMKKQGFTQTLQVGDEELKLPPAEYNYVGEILLSDVMVRARAAANAVKKSDSFEVLVTESNGRTTFGLKKV